MWKKGTTDGYRWEAKVYTNGSMFGIDNGRVSKLSIYGANGSAIYAYDRGLDMDNAPEGLVARVIEAATK